MNTGVALVYLYALVFCVMGGSIWALFGGSRELLWAAFYLVAVPPALVVVGVILSLIVPSIGERVRGRRPSGD